MDEFEWFKTIVLFGCLGALIVFLILIWDKQDPTTVAVVQGEPASLDAFGRSRVSEPLTLSDSKNVYLSGAEYNDLTVNGGTILHVPEEASFLLSVTGVIGSRSTRQTRMYHNYLPGKSQVCLMSFKFGAMETGIIRRVGYFDDDNGVFLEQNGTDNDYYVVRREKTTGLIKEYRTGVANWDYQGSLFDFTKVQLLKIDFQWLGVGKIRFFLSNAKEELIYTMFLANENTTVSFSEPNLPVRYEILNDGGVGAPGDSYSMKMICTTTMSEGGYVEYGLDRHASTGNLPRTIVNGGDTLPVIAIKLKSSYEGRPNRHIVRPLDFSIYVEDHPIMFTIYRLESESQITGGAWVSAGTQSPVEYNNSATGFTLVGGSQELNGGHLGASRSRDGGGVMNSGAPTSAKREIITQNYDSTDSQVWVIVCQALGNTANVNSLVWASVQWREIY